MAWLKDFGSNVSDFYGKVMSKQAQYSVPGLVMKAAGKSNPISDFYDREFSDKADLRSSEFLEFSSNLPLVGNLIRGINGVNKLEDLYARTGLTPAYPGSPVSGSGALGSAAGTIAKVADGIHDLYEYYAGEKDLVNDRMNPAMFR